MTVQPGKHTMFTAWHLTVAVSAWATYFASIVVVYLIALARGSMAGQRSAAWGMSLSLAIALVVFPMAVVRPQHGFACAAAVPSARTRRP